jgi:hypothetical protein
MKPVQGMAMTPTPEARKPAAAGTMEVTPATPAQPAMEGMSMGATTEPGRGSEGLEGMAEPPPSSLNGRLILILFAVLNAGIIAIAAVMKLRRDNPKTPSEVKA